MSGWLAGIAAALLLGISIFLAFAGHAEQPRAARTIDKFETADAGRSKWLTPADYASTAPKPKPRKEACACS